MIRLVVATNGGTGNCTMGGGNTDDIFEFGGCDGGGRDDDEVGGKGLYEMTGGRNSAEWVFVV